MLTPHHKVDICATTSALLCKILQGEAAEVAAILQEEQVELLDEDQLKRLREIDALTGLPRANDILLHAVPVCGPYSALQGYKYRLKLQPGSQRKGKAAKQVSVNHL